MKELREIIINKALIHPDHLWGVERKLTLTIVLIAVTMIALSLSIWPKIFAIFLFVFGFSCLKMMAKADPIMSQTYFRHILYKEYYLAHSTPYCRFEKKYK